MKQRRQTGIWLMLAPLYIFTILFVAGPLIYMVVLSFLQRGEVWGVVELFHDLFLLQIHFSHQFRCFFTCIFHLCPCQFQMLLQLIQLFLRWHVFHSCSLPRMLSGTAHRAWLSRIQMSRQYACLSI